MKKLSTFVYALFAVAAAVAAPTANEDFVIAEDARTYTNAVNAAKDYTDMAAASAVSVAAGAANAYTDAAVSNVATNARDKADLAVYRKVGVGDAWMLVGDDGAITNNATGVFTDSGDGSGSWAFYIGGQLVAASYSTGTLYDYEVEWHGGRDIGLTGIALRSYGYQATADRLATTNGMITAGMVTNIVNGVAPVPGNYAAVSNAAMNAAQNATNYTDALRNDLDFGDFTPWRSINSDYADEAIGLRLDSGIVRDADDISTQLDAATTTNAQQSTQLTTLSGQVATIGARLNAEDARFVVTNFDSVTHTPEAYVEIKLPDESWLRIWSEMTRWNYLFDYYLPTNYYDKAAVNAALNDKADRAWGFYDSTTGAYAPDGYTWISSEKIAIAANLAYQRTITTEGSIWILESNGVVTETGGMTNGFFRISDDEGNSLFEIVKGNKRTVGADASSCQIVAGFSPTKLQIGYSIVSDVHPTLYVCESLTTQNWKAETDSDCVANVAWSGTSGAYVVQVQGKSAYSSLFVKATYEVGGETYISNAAPVSMQYMMINGVKYAVGTATISGNTVLTLTVAP